jgi:hypothetical protein
MQRSSFAHLLICHERNPYSAKPPTPRCCPAPTRRDRPRTFGYPCCGLCRSAECRRRSGIRPRDSVEQLAFALDRENCARTFPVRSSSSLTFFDASTSTPCLMVTLRTSFSPTKFLISTSNWSVSLFFSMLTLIGKLNRVSGVPTQCRAPSRIEDGWRR